MAERVPQRFDTLALLVVTSAFAGVFGLLRALGAPPVVFVSILTLLVVASVCQMWTRLDPRLVSVTCGAILSPILAVVVLASSGARVSVIGYLLVVLIWFLLGGLVGYFAGTLAAGLFLVLAILRGERPIHFRAPHPAPVPSSPTPAPSAPTTLPRPALGAESPIAESPLAARLMLADPDHPPPNTEH